MHSSDRYFQRVQIGAILAVVIGAVVIATGFMLQRDERLTGNNFVRSAVLLATLDGDHPVLCTDGQHVPAGTGGVRLFVGTWGRPGPRLDATLTSSSGKSLATGSASNYKDGSFAKIPLLGLKGTVDGAKLCLRVTGGRVAFAGEPNGAIDGDSNLTIGTRTLTSDLHVEYVGFGRPTAAAQIPTILARASLFRPGWVGPWTYYLLALLGIALLGLAVTLLVRFAGGGMRRRQWTILIALITFGNCFIWSLVTPAFQVPDEAAHYAYVDTLAQRGMPGKHVGAGAGAYSNSLVLALQITAVNIVQNDQGKPPWFKSQEQAWQKADAALGDTANIGSGWSPAATYSPLYYGPAVVPYKLAGDNTFSRIWLIRLYSALMVAAAAALAFLLALELAPRTAWFAPVAGLAVAFEPMMVHIGAGVQNDSMLILTATAMLYAVVRMLKRGLTIKWAVIAGALLAFGIHVKPVMVGLAPAVLLAACILGFNSAIFWSERVKALAAGLASASAVWVAGYLLFGSSGETASALVSGTDTSQPFSLTGLFTYAWDWFLPPLPGFHNWLGNRPPIFSVFFRGVIADFNHLDTHFAEWFYVVLATGALAMAAVIGRLAYRERSAWRQWLPASAFLFSALFGLMLFIILTGYLVLISTGGNFAQGRYLLPCISIIGVFVATAALGFGRRWGAMMGTLFVLGLGLLNLFSLGLSLSRFYL